MSKDFQEIIQAMIDGTRVIPGKNGILFAVSGGPDSVALVDLVANEMPEIKARMHIAYFHNP